MAKIEIALGIDIGDINNVLGFVTRTEQYIFLCEENTAVMGASALIWKELEK